MFFSLPVFMYHSVSRFRHGLCVPPELFEEHCRTLAEAGWRGVSLAEAEEYFLHGRALPEKSCLFTFDDGYLDNYVYAEPLLRRYGHHGVIFPVLEMLSDRQNLRPTMEHPRAATRYKAWLDALDRRPRVMRNGFAVGKIAFCSWNELRHMQEHGNMSAAPHSLRHDRVVRNLDFHKVHRPKNKLKGFFSVPPFEALWGFPKFELGHSLAERAYALNPDIAALIKAITPQERRAARRFSRGKHYLRELRKHLAALPYLGVLEEEEAYRARVATELARCKALFREKLGREARSFCWPWGHNSAIGREEARKAGFQVLFTTSPGPNRPGGAEAVHRVPVRGGSGRELLARVRREGNALYASLHAAWFFAVRGRKGNYPE